MGYGITLPLATDRDIPYLKEKIMEAFAVAAVERFGEDEANRAPHADELERAYRFEQSQSAEACRVHCILKDGVPVGGAVVKINEQTRRNKMDLFFIFKEYHGHGLGHEAWKAFEQEYPQTAIWELITPYFEKRNINFYVNKCGFHIVKYYNKHYLDEEKPFPIDGEDDGYFLFVKVM